MVPGNRLGCLLLAGMDMAISHMSLWAWSVVVRVHWSMWHWKGCGASSVVCVGCSTLSRRSRTSCVWLVSIYFCLVWDRTPQAGFTLSWIELLNWFSVVCTWALYPIESFLCAPHAVVHETLSSRDSEPGFGTPPQGKLLLILVKFLGMEQVPLSIF